MLATDLKARARTVDSKLADKIIEASDHHWHDVEYYRRLAVDQMLTRRIKRKVRTIALHYWRLHDGGTERVTSRLASIWRALGYRVLLLTDGEPTALDYPVDNLVERFSLPPHRERYVTRGAALARLLREEKVDLFVSNLWVETTTGWDVFVAKSVGVPVVVGWHNVFDAGIYDGSDIAAFRERLAAYQSADVVVCLSLMDQYWFSTQGISARTIHNPLTFSQMPETVSPLSSKNIVWVGRVEQHQKRAEHVVRMMPLVLQRVPDATLTVVGDGPDRVKVEDLARALGVHERIKFVGYSQDVERHLAEAAVHVMTSEFEGSPMVLSEAWSHGVPTVMYDLSYLEFLRRGKGFISVPQRDYESLGREVAQVLADDETRGRLGREAREVAQSFFDLRVEHEWKALFDDIETKEDMAAPVSPEDAALVAPILTRHLVERLYAVDSRAAREHEALSAELASAGRRRDRASSGGPVAATVGALAATLDARPRARLAKIRTVDFGHIGLGDNMMAWVGLHALLSHDVRPTADDCVMYVPHDLAGLAAAVFAPYRLRVEGVQTHSRRPLKSPVFTPLPPETGTEWVRAFLGSDWRMNCFEALDAQKTIPRFQKPPKPSERIRLGLSERIIFRRRGWQAAEADYVGYRLWRPLAAKMGVMPLRLLTFIKQSLPALRQTFSEYIDERAYRRQPAARFAIFPAGKSFQSFPAAACRSIQDRLPAGEAVFYVQDNDPWHAEYRVAGLNLRNLASVEDLFWTVRSARFILSTDSFSSHIAQFLRDDFVLALTRDFNENIVHPGAHPIIVANHPSCAPCNYVPRTDSRTCSAGFESCVAFGSSQFLDELLAALISLDARPSHRLAKPSSSEFQESVDI